MAVMIHRSFKFRLYPTDAQAEQLGQIIGVCRFVYNLAWEQRRDFWRQYRRSTGRHISFASQGLELTQLRAEFDWIRAVSSAAQAHALLDLDQAYANFFAGRSSYPTPRKRGVHNSFRLRGRETKVRHLNAKWSEVQIPHLGFLKFRRTNAVVGKVATVTVASAAGVWSVVFSAECESRLLEASPSSVGVDRGVARTLTLSTGEHMQMPLVGALTKRRVAAQRVLSRRKRGSNRYKAQRARVALLRAKEARIRTDWCHRASTDIARRFGTVAIEALKIANMTASAKGTVDVPGKGVRQKAGLNRSILEQSWGRWAYMLEYKLADRGGHLVTVPAQFTSQTCASCGVVDARSRESQAVFLCVACGHRDNADVNAAKEILRRCTSELDAEAWIAGPLKRQPMESQHV